MVRMGLRQITSQSCPARSSRRFDKYEYGCLCGSCAQEEGAAFEQHAIHRLHGNDDTAHLLGGRGVGGLTSEEMCTRANEFAAAIVNTVGPGTTSGVRIGNPVTKQSLGGRRVRARAHSCLEANSRLAKLVTLRLLS